MTLLLLAGWLPAQTRVSGTVKDGKGHPIHGASITIKDSYDGATTDSLGNFHFQAGDKGNFTLITTNIGYNSVEQPVTLAGTPLELHIVMKEQLSELKAVTITAGSFTAGDAKRGAVLSSLDIATTAGSNADITAALKTLPGAQQVGEQEGLFVRGGAGYEAKQYIDGTLVNNPYYTSVPDIAQRGRFSPFLFKGTVFSTGGYSALYGEALSSVVLLESIDLPEKSEIDATISPLVVGLGTQQLAKNKQSSYGFSYDYVNAYAYFHAVPQDVDYFRMPQFHNADANFRIRTKGGGMIKYYTTFAYNDLGLRRQDWDSLNMKDAFGLTNHNWYNNLSYREYLNNGWKMDLGASYSTNLDNLGQKVQNAMNQPQTFPDTVFWMNSKNFTIDQRQDLSQVRAVFDKKLGTLSAIRFGSEYWYSYNYQKYRSPGYYYTIDTMYKFKDNFNSLFAESDIYLTNALAAKVGLRYEHSTVINKSDLAPRVSLAYRTGPEAQVSLAYGIFYQKPENSQLFASQNVGFTKATHYIINYQKMSKDRIFRVEAYYKKYEDLIKTVPLSNFNTFFTTYNNSGSGYAKGIELFWRDKKSIKDFDYWISYSYLDTKRNYLNYTGQLTPNFAATHTASIVMKRFFTKIKSGVNVTYSYATGRPYYNFILNGLKYNLAEQGKTKDYNSLNLSAEYVPSIGNTKAKTFVVLFASVSNVLGYNSVYGYNFSYSGLYKQPITPPAKRFYFIGCFLSWGVDRSQDAINNNL